MQPLRQTSRFMGREYGCQDVAVGLGTKSELVRPPAEVYLEDVVDFLDWLREHRSELEAGVSLQGLAGLQLQEATRLTWDRLDLDRGLIEITGEVKNKYRNRVIPVCPRILTALRRSSLAKVQAADGRIIPYHWMTYSKSVTAAIRQFNPQLGWQPKDLRNCVLQFALRQGQLNDVWEQYVGHKPKSVTGLHYINRLATSSRGQNSDLERRMDLFREQVIGPLASALTQYGENGKGAGIVSEGCSG